MKNTLIKGVVICLVLVSIVACNTTAPVTEIITIDKEIVKQEIQQRENEFAALYNSGELKDIGYYAEDAVSFSQNSAPLVGKAAIVENLLEGLKSSSSSNKISFTTKEVFVSANGLQVLEIGYYEVVDSTNKAFNTGNYMSLFEKRDGKYVCLRDMSASDIPLE